ncbi:MAG: hypothetical protein Q7T82_07270 [Armatimonadota bacterium]|nr:hypothetical protein [Armatimonadota bacterium]
MRRRMPTKGISQIWLDPQPQGLRAVYLVEARDQEEALEVEDLFAELETDLQVRQLCRGKLFSYAVKTQHDQQQTLLELEQALRSNFGFVILHRSFDDVIYKIVSELCVDTGSDLLPMTHCDICGKLEPFPDTVINLADRGGATIASGAYCGVCTAAFAATSNKEFLLSLLHADTRDFSALESAELVRARSRKQDIRFRIQSRAEHAAANN